MVKGVLLMNKVIGVCLTLTHAEISREFLKALYDVAKIDGYKLLCFNSSIDFKYSKSAGAEAVYDLIPYELLDALVILHSSIHDERIVNKIIDNAKKYDVPVILSRGERKDIYSVSGKYENAFKQMIRHIVTEHNAKEFFYISGRVFLEDNLKSDSAVRFFMLKETLKEFGIEITYDNVECGEYWEFPTFKIIDDLVKNRTKLPDAIICANDVMASAACSRLKQLGFDVPKDVIVTGFDGLECARFSDPILTTCYDDINQMASLVIKMVKDIEENDIPISHYYYEFRPIFAQSCGCKYESQKLNDENKRLFRSFRMQHNDEENTDRWLENLFEINTLDYFKDDVSRYLTSTSALLLRNDDAHLLNDSLGEKSVELPEELLILANESDRYNNMTINKNAFMSHLIASMDTEGIYIVSAVYVKELIMGMYLEKIQNPHVEGFSYNRHVRAMNKGLLACLTQERHNLLKQTVAKNKYKDVLTGLDNISGFQRWFNDYASREENHKTFAEFCMFSFINHDAIAQDFDNEEYEECVKFIAKLLVKSHCEGTYIARVSLTDFAVVLFAEDASDRHNKIYEAVGIFYEAIANRNEANPNGPQIEVSSGSVDMNPGWNDSGSEYINFGLAELYKNRMALYEGQEAGVNLNTKAERDAINLLNLIIKENRLIYHFQPIVDAHTGNIVAYEALMRVTGGIRMNPLELLSIAKRHRLLGLIERATMFNVLGYIKNNEKLFDEKKIFINTIPGHFLKDYDLDEFKLNYSQYFDKCVMEITEDNSITAEEIDRIKRAGGKNEVFTIAVDDYGTGHSNIMNLMLYKPDIVKIDRFLITDLHLDKNKQMFVNNMINFARENNITVLAEGVETKEELTMAIKMGVDLIQGYYTARPQEEILLELPSEIKQSVLDANK